MEEAVRKELWIAMGIHNPSGASSSHELSFQTFPNVSKLYETRKGCSLGLSAPAGGGCESDAFGHQDGYPVTGFLHQIWEFQA